jgi:hypothetical protein
MATAKNSRGSDSLRVVGAAERLAVPVDQLCRRCDPATLPLKSTKEVAPLQGTVGQEWAVTAIEFGVEIDSGECPHHPSVQTWIGPSPTSSATRASSASR